MTAGRPADRGLLIRGARVVTVSDAGVLPRADVLCSGGVIERVAASIEPPPECDVVDAAGRVLVPGFVDCHTHACWVGDRLDEWEQKRAGAGYLDILRAGGGIMSTVRAVRTATEAELADVLTETLSWMLGEGTTTVEVKSGYGLDTDAEMKMLRAIDRAGADVGRRWGMTVVPTACIGHALDPETDRDAFVERTVTETLDAVHAAFPGIAIDAYCEEGAWSLDECARLFDRAAELGHPCRVHADQFHALGMVEHAVSRGFRSVDHLEATGPETLRALGASQTTGVVLPCSGFHLDGRYADARAVLDAGGRVAIGSNANPGSAPAVSMPMAMALATRHCGLTPRETVEASTRSGAVVLELDDRGRIEPSLRADLVLLRHRDERELAHTFGGRHALAVVCAGRLVRPDHDNLPVGSDRPADRG
ncbi:MAG: imidazolonepropionase [Planctomycetota bacterium]